MVRQRGTDLCPGACGGRGVSGPGHCTIHIHGEERGPDPQALGQARGKVSRE